MLKENRQGNLEYKEHKTKGLIVRVSTELSSHQSGAFTKLLKSYESLDDQISRLTAEKDKLNADIKTEVESLFDAEDALITRVVTTCSYTLSLAKATPEGTKTATDHEKVLAELVKLVPALEKQIADLTKQFTTVSKVAAKSPALRVSKLEEGLGSLTIHDLIVRARSFYRSILQKCHLIDQQLHNIKLLLK